MAEKAWWPRATGGQMTLATAMAIDRLDSSPHDLEDVCAGPVAWDISGLVTSARARGLSAKFIEELLAAYGEPGVEGLETFLEAHALYDIVWQAFEARRRPRAMKRAAASLALWRDRRAG